MLKSSRMFLAPGPSSPVMSKSTFLFLSVLAAMGPAPFSKDDAGFSIVSTSTISRSLSDTMVNVGALENVSATLLDNLRVPNVGIAILIYITNRGVMESSLRETR